MRKQQLMLALLFLMACGLHASEKQEQEIVTDHEQMAYLQANLFEKTNRSVFRKKVQAVATKLWEHVQHVIPVGFFGGAGMLLIRANEERGRDDELQKKAFTMLGAGAGFILLRKLLSFAFLKVTVRHQRKKLREFVEKWPEHKEHLKREMHVLFEPLYQRYKQKGNTSFIGITRTVEIFNAIKAIASAAWEQEENKKNFLTYVTGFDAFVPAGKRLTSSLSFGLLLKSLLLTSFLMWRVPRLSKLTDDYFDRGQNGSRLAKTSGKLFGGIMLLGFLYNYLTSSYENNTRAHKAFVDMIPRWPYYRERAPEQVHGIFDHLYSEYEQNGSVTLSRSQKNALIAKIRDILKKSPYNDERKAAGL